MRTDVVVAIIEASLGRELLIGFDPVEVEVEELVQGEPGRCRLEFAPVDLRDELTPRSRRLGRAGKTAPCDLFSSTRNRVAPTLTLMYQPRASR
jgi:hypothetical protein